MTQITLDRETFERYRAAGAAELLSPDGEPFATLTPLAAPPPADGPTPDFAAHGWTEEEIAEAKRPVAEWSTPEEVWERIFAEHGRPGEERP